MSERPEIDDLRQAAMKPETFDPYEQFLVEEVQSDKMFGMTAVERMFVSIGCFVLTSLGGFLLLLVLEKIQL